MEKSKMETIKVKLTLTEGMLGTSPASEEIYRDYIGSKAADPATVDDEVAALIEAAEEAEAEGKGRTIFPRLPDGTPFLYDYQVKGFFKDACSMLGRLTGRDEHGKKLKAVNESGKLPAHKKIIDGLIFVSPRQIPIIFDGEMGVCQRPLRAQTAMGERVALACSEEVPAGATMEFQIICLDGGHMGAVREWLNYGALRGLGQWRNSGKGRFTWEEISDEG